MFRGLNNARLILFCMHVFTTALRLLTVDFALTRQQNPTNCARDVTPAGGTSRTFESGTKTCYWDGCSITYTFDFSSIAGQILSAKLSVEQSGDTNYPNEYTELSVGGSKVADCKTSTNEWDTAASCSNVDVKSHITSSKTLVVLVDATADVGPGGAGGPENTALAVRLTATIVDDSTSNSLYLFAFVFQP
jgi:hypothetical protein